MNVSRSKSDKNEIKQQQSQKPNSYRGIMKKREKSSLLWMIVVYSLVLCFTFSLAVAQNKSGIFGKTGESITATVVETDIAKEDKELQKKLKKLREYVKSVLEDSKVPGIAIGIIKDGEVVFAEGFGYRNLEKKLPVTTQTLFAICSCSKAFTTMSIGMLVDDGEVEWGKPVRNYLPSFQLKDPYITANMTVRDLVTHRSGLPGHGAIWYGSSFTRKEIFDRLRYLDFSKGFREVYQYNNLMFMTAGYLVGQATNSTWENFVRNRIFRPLDMTHSNFFIEDLKRDSDYATPYNIEGEKVEVIPFRNCENIGPAGSINSCIDDMLKWIQFHINNGKVGEKQLVPESIVKDMRTPYMHISSGMKSNELSHANYGLGWRIYMYRGHKLVTHGGGIDGFTSSTSFMPFDSLGVFVVTNAESRISQSSRMIDLYIYDLLLGVEPKDRYAEYKERQEKAKKGKKKKKEKERVEIISPTYPLKKYVGEYEHPGYGIFTITCKDDTLWGKFKSFEFKLEHRNYNTFKTIVNIQYAKITVTFFINVKGDIDKLTSPLEPRVDEIVFKRKVP